MSGCPGSWSEAEKHLVPCVGIRRVLQGHGDRLEAGVRDRSDPEFAREEPHDMAIVQHLHRAGFVAEQVSHVCKVDFVFVVRRPSPFEATQAAAFVVTASGVGAGFEGFPDEVRREAM